MSLLDVIKRSDIEEVMRRHRPTDDGKDGSKERYAYIEWLGIYNAIRELPSVKYDSFCDVPMAEAAEVMRMYKNGELAHLKGREPQPERRCGNCKFLTYRFNKVWCDIKCENPHDVVCDKWERSE